MTTDLLFLRDAYLREFEATVTGVDPVERSVALDRTAFYATGGGQPHDTGLLAGLAVICVEKARGVPGQDTAVGSATPIWHKLAGDGALPKVGDVVHGELDWKRRHQLMRTHTALHVLCGVIWNEWGVPVTGGSMEPLSARMDFEFAPLPDDFSARVQEKVNAELVADRPIEVTFLPRGVVLSEAGLIRTKVSLVPDYVPEIRVVDIVGLDRQADGGTHVRSTAEVGKVVVVKTESKGKANKRIRLRVEDAA